MRKPEIWMTNLKLFIKHKSWFLVAGWTANKGDELHGDYEYVKDREQWEKLLNDLKNLNEKTKISPVCALWPPYQRRN